MGSRFVDANPGSCDKGDVLLIKAVRDTEGILMEHISRGRVFFKNGRVFVWLKQRCTWVCIACVLLLTLLASAAHEQQYTGRLLLIHFFYNWCFLCAIIASCYCCILLFSPRVASLCWHLVYRGVVFVYVVTIHAAPVNVTANCVCVKVDACTWYMYDYDIHVCAFNVCLSMYYVWCDSMY